MWSQGHGLWPLAFLTSLLILTFQMPEALTNTVPELEEFLRQNSDLSQFMTLISESREFDSALEYKQGTIFAPSNNALSEFKKAHPNDLNNYVLLYHYTNTPTPLSDLEETSLSTELPGNLPIWVTKVDSDVFLNGAKIIRGDKKVLLGKNKREQTVHTINKVLEPTIPLADVSGSKMNNPDAKKFLEFSKLYGISRSHSTSLFAEQVKQLNRLDFFQSPGKHTFFLPVDAAFQPGIGRIASVDNKTVDGHMIVGKAIFLGVNEGSAKPMLTFETSAAAGNFPVEVSIEFSRSTNSYSVTSENLVEDPKAKHRKGKVRAQILTSNIPVKNGVIHLISRPLVLIDSNVYKLMQGPTPSGGEKGDGENAPLRKFFEIIDTFQDIKDVLSDTGPNKQVTVFAPTSSVLEKSSNFKELYEKASTEGPEQEEAKKQLGDIIKLHIVQQDITSEDILNASKNKTHPFSVKPLATGKRLYFSVVKADGDNRDRDTISIVDGGGTSATIRHADIGATNGVIHLVDRVLGIGDNTIYDRLKSDPFLRSTYNISLQEGFNQIFKKKNLKFTFFAPFNPAWEGLRFENPSKYQILFEGLHGGHAKRIMERHLILRHEKSLEDLYRESVTGNHTIQVNEINTMQGEIQVVSVSDPNFLKYTEKYGTAPPRRNHTRFHDDYKYVIFWKKKEVRVVHGDIKCANGYLHIIDTVLMTPDDIFVNSARDILNSSVNFLLMILLSLLL